MGWPQMAPTLLGEYRPPPAPAATQGTPGEPPGGTGGHGGREATGANRPRQAFRTDWRQTQALPLCTGMGTPPSRLWG